MKKMIKRYILALEELKITRRHPQKDDEFYDGCNCASDCINDGLDTRIAMLKDFEKDTDTTMAMVEAFLNEFTDNLISALNSCKQNESNLFYQGFNQTVDNFCDKIKNMLPLNNG